MPDAETIEAREEESESEAPAKDETSLDALLEQWGREQGEAAPESTVPTNDNAEGDAPPAETISLADFETLRGRLDAHDLERMQAQEDADARAVVERANEAVADMLLPEGFAERWIKAEYWQNPELQRAWDNRYSSDDALAHAERVIDRSIRDMLKAAKAVPDREATANRELVAAALRGQSKNAPDADDIDAEAVKNMSDADFYRYRNQVSAKG